MKIFKITYKNTDSRRPYIAHATKWARDKSQAYKYIFKKMPDKDGYAITKRGQPVKILNTEEEPTPYE